MRVNTQSGNVVSSHSSACGASSLATKARIESRSCSCSSVKMKWRRGGAVVGLEDVGGGHGADANRCRGSGRPVELRPWPTRRCATSSPPRVVATITLDQPDTRNALSDAVLDELIAAFAAARDDDAVRCVVLTSSHERVFSSGGDLSGFAADVAARRQAPGHRALPAAVPADRRARQADPVRRQRARAGRGARAGAGVRPDRRARGGARSARPRSTSGSSRS